MINSSLRRRCTFSFFSLHHAMGFGHRFSETARQAETHGRRVCPSAGHSRQCKHGNGLTAGPVGAAASGRRSQRGRGGGAKRGGRHGLDQHARRPVQTNRPCQAEWELVSVRAPRQAISLPMALLIVISCLATMAVFCFHTSLSLSLALSLSLCDRENYHLALRFRENDQARATAGMDSFWMDGRKRSGREN